MSEETGGLFGVSLSQNHLEELLMAHAPPPPLNEEATKVCESANTFYFAHEKWKLKRLDVIIAGKLGPYGVSKEADTWKRRFLFWSGRRICLSEVFITRWGMIVLLLKAFHRWSGCEQFIKRQICCPGAQELPSQCNVCKLTLVSSPHLARSYHHLFPVQPFTVRNAFLTVILSNLTNLKRVSGVYRRLTKWRNEMLRLPAKTWRNKFIEWWSRTFNLSSLQQHVLLSVRCLHTWKAA